MAPRRCVAGALRAAEFTRLEGSVYVDHAGSTLFSERQLQDAHQVPPAQPQPSRPERCVRFNISGENLRICV